MSFKISVFVVLFTMVLGSVAFAQFYTTTQFLAEDRDFQLAYVAGANDMLKSLSTGPNYDTGQGNLYRRWQCLANRGTLEALTDWTVREMLNESQTYNAASIMFVDACR